MRLLPIVTLLLIITVYSGIRLIITYQDSRLLTIMSFRILTKTLSFNSIKPSKQITHLLIRKSNREELLTIALIYIIHNKHLTTEVEINHNLALVKIQLRITI